MILGIQNNYKKKYKQVGYFKSCLFFTRQYIMLMVQSGFIWLIVLNIEFGGVWPFRAATT